MLGTLWNEMLRRGLDLPFCVPMGTRDDCFARPSPQGLRLHFQGAQTVPSSARPTSLPSSTPNLVPALPHPPSEVRLVLSHFQGAQTAPLSARSATLPSSAPDLILALPHPPSEVRLVLSHFQGSALLSAPSSNRCQSWRPLPSPTEISSPGSCAPSLGYKGLACPTCLKLEPVLWCHHALMLA